MDTGYPWGGSFYYRNASKFKKILDYQYKNVYTNRVDDEMS